MAVAVAAEAVVAVAVAIVAAGLLLASLLTIVGVPFQLLSAFQLEMKVANEFALLSVYRDQASLLAERLRPCCWEKTIETKINIK